MSDVQDSTTLAHEKEKEKELALAGSEDPQPVFHSRLAELEEPSRHVYNHTTKM